jgi:enoyl-[acyl-carrier protein] reductase I
MTAESAPSRTRTALVTGVANKYSIAWAIAQELSNEGYELCITYADERLEEKVKELAASIPNAFTLPLNVARDEDFAQIGTELSKRWTHLDGVVHAIAFANREDLGGRFVDTSRDGFRVALDISAYSFVALVKSVLPLLETARGSAIALSYLGGQRVVPNYNVMGVAKAALEMSAKYLAVELGRSGVRVNVLSPGPIKTLAAKGIHGFGEMLRLFVERSPLGRPITQEEVGKTAAFMLSDRSSGITGQVIFIDGGHEIIGY